MRSYGSKKGLEELTDYYFEKYNKCKDAEEFIALRNEIEQNPNLSRDARAYVAQGMQARIANQEKEAQKAAKKAENKQKRGVQALNKQDKGKEDLVY